MLGVVVDFNKEINNHKVQQEDPDRQTRSSFVSVLTALVSVGLHVATSLYSIKKKQGETN